MLGPGQILKTPLIFIMKAREVFRHTNIKLLPGNHYKNFIQSLLLEGFFLKNSHLILHLLNHP